MKRKRTRRTTHIEVETREVVVTASDSAPTVAWCPGCERQAPMQSPEMAARLAGVDVRTIYQWVEARQIHFSERPGSGLMICLVTLVRFARAEPQMSPSKHHS